MKACQFFSLCLIVTFIIFCISSCSLFRGNDIIKIGFLGSFTGGNYADWGRNTRDGAILAVDEINRSGGINGKRIELIIKDDRHDTASAQGLIDEFYREGVRIIIGPVLSSVSIALNEYAKKKEILLLSPSAATDELTGLDDNFIRVLVPNSEFAVALADYMIKKRKPGNICIVYDEINISYSTSWKDVFSKKFKEGGGNIIFMKSFKIGDDYSNLSREIMKKRPDGVLIIGGVYDMAAICQSLKKTGLRSQIAGSGEALSDELITNGGNAVEGLIAAAQFEDDSNATFREFKEKFLKNFGYEPLYSAVYGYDAVNMLISVIKKRGKTDSASVKGDIINMKGFKSPFGDFEIDSAGDARRKTTIVTVKNGKFVKAE